MKYKERYSIGEVSKICNVSKKALRFYDKIGLIKSERDVSNNYRYYSSHSLFAVPVIKYYKQMGFKLDEMQGFIEGNFDVEGKTYQAMKQSFISKIDELQKTQEDTHRKYVSVKGWHDLITEAEMVVDNGIHEVGVKYVDAWDYLYQDQQFNNDIEAAIINIDFSNFVEEIHHKITGPVIINFSSFKDRMQDIPQKVKIMQRTLRPCREDERVTFGGRMMISCYHTGPHETVKETYEKICRWARKHGYVSSEDSYERYVTDYWTTRNSAKFVTEVMMNVSRKE